MTKIFLSYPFSEEDTKLIDKFKEALGSNALIYDELAVLTEEEAERLNSDTRFRYREPPIGAKEPMVERIADSDEVIIIITKRFKYDSYGQFAFKTSPIVEYTISQARKFERFIVCFYEGGVPIDSLFPQLKVKISFNRRDILEIEKDTPWYAHSDMINMLRGGK